MKDVVTQAAMHQCGLLSFQANWQLVEQTRRMAGDMPLAEYLVEAVREKNERETNSRLTYLSRTLAAEWVVLAPEFEATVGDGF